MSRTTITRWTGVFLLLFGACQAQIDDPSGSSQTGSGGRTGTGGSAGPGSGGSGANTPTVGTGGSGAPIPGGTGGSGTPVAPVDCSQPRASAVRLRVLTESQYNNSVLDIFQISGAPAKNLTPTLDDVTLEQRADLASTVATQAVANLSKWAPCTPPATGSATACEQQFIDKIGAKVYRRPLTDAERTDLKTLFDAGIKEKDFATGVEWFVTALLQSPQFMYEVVRPAAAEKAGEVRPLSDYEFASRLAYFVWDGPPDDALLTAAANGELADATKRDAQVARMLQDARFSRGVAQFYTRWLNLNIFNEVARSDEPAFDQNVVNSLRTSLLMSATQIYTAANPNISSLFSGDQYYLNDVLGKFYGVAVTGTAFTPVAMSGQGRRGILTHPAMMAALARPHESFPIGRGLFLLRNVLCKIIESPPANLVIPMLPPVMDGQSTREQTEMYTAGAVCQSCHGSINPAGFVFEAFDQVGRYRTMDHGRPVNTSGMLSIGKDVDGPFATGDELLAKLGDSKDLRACFAEKYVNFALAKGVTDAADTCSIQSVAKSFSATGDLKQLVVAVAGSESFRLRLAEGVGK